MAERLDQDQTVTLEELAISNSFEIAALVNVLERKGILTSQEVLAEIKMLRQQSVG
jgi:hypothetical protein